MDGDFLYDTSTRLQVRELHRKRFLLRALQAALVVLICYVAILWVARMRRTSRTVMARNAAVAPAGAAAKAPMVAMYNWNSVEMMKQQYLNTETPDTRGAQFERLFVFIKEDRLERSILSPAHILEYLGDPDLAKTVDGQQRFVYFYNKHGVKDWCVEITFNAEENAIAIVDAHKATRDFSDYAPYSNQSGSGASGKPVPGQKTEDSGF
ncbi:MAG: hypothetical protein M5U26_15435 [Planctomycetota bacterium]|nr:hypothetical protein [Planctomycetota bacterium]